MKKLLILACSVLLFSCGNGTEDGTETRDTTSLNPSAGDNVGQTAPAGDAKREGIQDVDSTHPADADSAAKR